MIPLLKRLIWAFFYDELAAKRWLRGGLFFIGGMAVNVLAFPYGVIKEWTLAEWGYRVAAAGALGFAGSIMGGQKNKTPEQIKAELEAIK
jgi:hypothetical protein